MEKIGILELFLKVKQMKLMSKLRLEKNVSIHAGLRNIDTEDPDRHDNVVDDKSKANDEGD